MSLAQSSRDLGGMPQGYGRFDRVAKIGPHPLLLVHETGHRLAKKMHLRWVRRTYSASIANPPRGARLVAPRVELPPAPRLPEGLADAAELLRHHADAALRHEVDLLGSGPVALGAEIDWHRDFKSGYVWPLAFYQDLAVTRLDDSSDAKVPWELSRGHQFTLLARAAVLFGDERYADELETQMRSWIAANPPGVGINWTNPMEIALRATNWVWALGTLERWRPIDKETLAAVTQSLQVHGRHIAAHLEGSPYLRSNHFLSNILGLLVLGASLEGDPAAGTWFRKAHRLLEREVLRQVHEDGASFEASTSYHGLALEILLIARWVAATRGEGFSRRFDVRVGRMLMVSRSVRHPNGRIPTFGDADDGRVLPATPDRAPNQDYVLWLGSSVLGLRRPLPGVPHPEVAWTLGVLAWQECRKRGAMDTPSSIAFPKGGIYVLRTAAIHAVVHCGDVGQNGNGGHAHNDTLSFELSAGVPVIVDSGTYVYTADPVARNVFRSTAAHNAVMVNGEEINPIDPAQLFRLKQGARIRVERWSTTADGAKLVASHDGYRRLPSRVLHTREVELNSSTGFRVGDRLTGEGWVDVSSLVHVAAGGRAVIDDDGCSIGVAGAPEIRVTPFGGAELLVDDGWVSERYGRRAPAPVVRLRIRKRLPVEFGYTLVAAGAVER